jgi:N-glycosylase/DNA lyase
MKNEGFDLAATIECGQFFRYKKEDGGYRVYSGNRNIFVRQGDELDGFWSHFFDLDRDYGVIYDTLSKNDPVMQRAVEFAPGIRMMNQDPWETLVCFILSASNNIPAIMTSVERIVNYFNEFPSPEALNNITLDELKSIVPRFHPKYIKNAAEKFTAFDSQFSVPTDELRKSLKTIKGVGNKIADCVMLFSMGRREVFPVDRWIERIVNKLYNVPTPEIQAFAKERFGEYAGYANQLLFHYGRLNKII